MSLARDHINGVPLNQSLPTDSVIARSAHVVTGSGRITSPPTFTLLSKTPGNRVNQQCRGHQSPYCIPSDLSDRRIDDPAMLLVQLNTILDTGYTFEHMPALEPMLHYCIRKHHDLGMVYGLLRPWWYSIPTLKVPLLPNRFDLLERRDDEARERAVVDGMVIKDRIPPRRVWDLYSNRVLPFWAIQRYDDRAKKVDIHTVSHAWMDPEQRRYVHTRINCEEWPVPIPNDLDLDDLRIELLNKRHTSVSTTEYVWLDVLCLRQEDSESSEREALRAKEWVVDVPTIGAIYRHCKATIVYLNGLGRPFEVTDLGSPRHWCNRAWTIQELCSSEHPLIGGITKESPQLPILLWQRLHFDLAMLEDVDLQTENTSFSKKLIRRVTNTRDNCARYIIAAVAEMSRRSAEGDVDKIAGLTYLFCEDKLPVFYEAKGIGAYRTVEDSWLRLIRCMSSEARGDMFYLVPFVGAGELRWAPSWYQILERIDDVMKSRDLAPLLTAFAEVDVGVNLDYPYLQLDHHKHIYSCLAIVLPDCHLIGLQDSTHYTDSRAARRAIINFRDHTGTEVTIHLIARHNEIIDDGTYCLLSNIGHYNNACRHWVVGSLDVEGRFEKTSVLEIDDKGGDESHRDLSEALSCEIVDDDSGEWTSRWIRRVELA